MVGWACLKNTTIPTISIRCLLYVNKVFLCVTLWGCLIPLWPGEVLGGHDHRSAQMESCTLAVHNAHSEVSGSDLSLNWFLLYCFLNPPDHERRTLRITSSVHKWQILLGLSTSFQLKQLRVLAFLYLNGRHKFTMGVFERIPFVKTLTNVGHHLSKFVALWV